ncbi:hypothetical protein GOA59_31350 [Sinorhizobium meliloti]|uniref:hypothetical protein n=1 Tax=Rhizobium meliloti TaxID=382 RepID=UPI000FD553F7|nr:hypothetical protein [Sinorhizobium meliloti]MDW9490400.1 hypothetical protein [Sinorhizobium meliloti]MDW9609315.1 hypothetical protein [Sinorhizobium meliloti]MDW9671125.1 hypothetical protein [Sinorhizobium meliloti]MDW9677174.1 hypothetical protein [Sinorhizobium meliloti]MDW9770209.1 hypothetical protein [Sinorhizobium meliloti]
MTQRYELHDDSYGLWSVIDRFTGWPARWEGISQTGLDYFDADDLTDLLNVLDERRRAKGKPESDELK